MFGDLFHELYPKAPICVLKFSNDNARRREEISTCEGRELGPDCIFRFIPMVGTIHNPTYPVSTQKAFESLKIGKFKNVKPNPGRRIDKHVLSRVSVALEEFHDQLETDIVRIFRQGVPNHRIILLAAANDVLHPCIRAIMHGQERVPIDKSEETSGGFFDQIKPEKERKLKVVVYSNTLDLRSMYDGFKIHSGCALRKYLADHPEDILEIVFFGIDRNLASKQELEFISSVQSEKITISVNYSDEFSTSKDDIIEILRSPLNTEPDQHLLVHFNVEVINVEPNN